MENEEESKIAKLVLATTQGDAAAQFELGGLYEKGESVPQDLDEAMLW
ncbi:MAG: SEL1-like repeat protein [Magnetococcales bacterium]|nr:SEL1-like repeat protein [Magnetococcales bacterium]